MKSFNFLDCRKTKMRSHNSWQTLNIKIKSRCSRITEKQNIQTDLNLISYLSVKIKLNLFFNMNFNSVYLFLKCVFKNKIYSCKLSRHKLFTKFDFFTFFSSSNLSYIAIFTNFIISRLLIFCPSSRKGQGSPHH